MKRTLCFIFIVLSLHAFSQETYYAASKTGLSMRSEPSASAKVIDKIAYGQKLMTLKDTTEQHSINTEGFTGYWWKVKWNNKVGYVVSSYLLPEAAPKATIKTVKDYLAQISAASGPLLTIKKGIGNTIEGSARTQKKQLYKNGMEWYQLEGYEYGNTVYILPDFTVEQGFLLLRLINEFEEQVTTTTAFPTVNVTATDANKQHGVQVEREMWDGKPGPVLKIKMTGSEAGYAELQIFDMEGQCVIVYSSGV